MDAIEITMRRASGARSTTKEMTVIAARRGEIMIGETDILLAGTTGVKPDGMAAVCLPDRRKSIANTAAIHGSAIADTIIAAPAMRGGP